MPPFNGPSLRWYQAVFADQRMMDALGNSLAVALVSSLVALLLGFLAAYGWPVSACPRRGSCRGC